MSCSGSKQKAGGLCLRLFACCAASLSQSLKIQHNIKRGSRTSWRRHHHITILHRQEKITVVIGVAMTVVHPDLIASGQIAHARIRRFDHYIASARIVTVKALVGMIIVVSPMVKAIHSLSGQVPMVDRRPVVLRRSMMPPGPVLRMLMLRSLILRILILPTLMLWSLIIPTLMLRSAGLGTVIRLTVPYGRLFFLVFRSLMAVALCNLAISRRTNQ